MTLTSELPVTTPAPNDAKPAAPTPAKAVVTVPRHGRIVVRAPYRPGLRARLEAAAGLPPRWEAETGVWSVPPARLGDVLDALAAVFSSVEVAAESASAGWSRYTVTADIPELHKFD